MFEIKTIKLSDIEIVQEIAKKTWPHTFGRVISSEQINYMLDLIYSTDSLKKQIEENKHVFLLASKDKRPLGFLSYELNYCSKPQTMIHKIYILPQSQGLGIGRQLIDFVSNVALGYKNGQLRLKVYIDNPKAIIFYEKLGFFKAGTEITDIGNNYLIEDYIMIKHL